MSTVISTTTIDTRLLRHVQLLGASIGRTPLHRISRLFNKPGVTVYAKKEWEQLSVWCAAGGQRTYNDIIKKLL